MVKYGISQIHVHHSHECLFPLEDRFIPFPKENLRNLSSSLYEPIWIPYDDIPHSWFASKLTFCVGRSGIQKINPWFFESTSTHHHHPPQTQKKWSPCYFRNCPQVMPSFLVGFSQIMPSEQNFRKKSWTLFVEGWRPSFRGKRWGVQRLKFKPRIDIPSFSWLVHGDFLPWHMKSSLYNWVV